ncbi:MAG: DUF169 domain-containing protein [Euryarchaeota archaeon]|nr:DUF169 domain-containing protein [Euryarchaeota archaeon]
MRDNGCARYPEIAGLMESGEPVCVTLGSAVAGESSDHLYCELIGYARYGRSFCIESQRCPVCEYILRNIDNSPHEYYFRSGRYTDLEVARCAAASLPRLGKDIGSIRIEPLSRIKGNIDVLILYLTPERVMRIVQALAYHDGKRVDMNTIGAASVCGDCTVHAYSKGIGFSFGCKGSRKHSGYPDHEVPVGIRFDHLDRIEQGLTMIPKTLD